jgi:hypothetical protein
LRASRVRPPRDESVSNWSGLADPPYCPTTDAERTAVALFEDTVIDRLFAFNTERAAEETATAPAAKPRRAARKKTQEALEAAVSPGRRLMELRRAR